MFDYDQDIVQYLLKENDEFKRLYEKHTRLKQQVNEAHDGAVPVDDFTLENLKKEKLLVKDKMASMIANYRRRHAIA